MAYSFQAKRINRNTLQIIALPRPGSREKIYGYLRATIDKKTRRVTAYDAETEEGFKAFRVNPSKGARAALKEAKIWLRKEILRMSEETPSSSENISQGHVLREHEIHSPLYSHPYAALKVKLTKGAKPRTLTALPGIHIVRAGTKFAPLPDDVIVVDGDGEKIPPTFKFYVSLETLNPFHLVVDAPSNLLRAW